MAVSTAYQSPKYIPQPADGWYHVLYGHVPGYQLDVIYRPQLPFLKLKLQHFSDLQLVIRHLRPVPQLPLAFAICNLSAHDTQHRPGHGALAIAAAVRLQQASDHAGRVSPVFTHAAVLVDQPIVAGTLSTAAEQFVQRFRNLGPTWYQGYYDENRPLDTLSQQQYVQHFADLPPVAAESGHLRWKPRGQAAVPTRVTILCPAISPLEHVVAAASRIAAILYYSRVRWLSIGNGDPQALEQMYSGNSTPELIVRFAHGTDPSPSLPQACTFLLEDLPSDEQSLAALLGLVPFVRPTTTTHQEETPSTSPILEASAVAPESGSEERATAPPDAAASVGMVSPECLVLSETEAEPTVALQSGGDLTLILPAFRPMQNFQAMEESSHPHLPALNVSLHPPLQRATSSKLGWMLGCAASAAIAFAGVQIYMQHGHSGTQVSLAIAPKAPSGAKGPPPTAPIGSSEKNSTPRKHVSTGSVAVTHPKIGPQGQPPTADSLAKLEKKAASEVGVKAASVLTPSGSSRLETKPVPEAEGRRDEVAQAGTEPKPATIQKPMAGNKLPVVAQKPQQAKKAAPASKPTVALQAQPPKKPVPSGPPGGAKPQLAQKGSVGSKPAMAKATTGQTSAEAQKLSPETVQALAAAKKAIDLCQRHCEVNPPPKSCVDATKRTAKQLSDHKEANQIRLEVSENLCLYCREAIQEYCKKRQQ